jgi:hypothetical protein
MINPHTAWLLIKSNAVKAMYVNMVFKSLVQERSYKVLNVQDDVIVIQRISGGNNELLSEATVIRAIQALNENNGIMQRRALISPTVAEETTFVLFHPQLTWSPDGNFIIDIEEN